MLLNMDQESEKDDNVSEKALLYKTSLNVLLSEIVAQ